MKIRAVVPENHNKIYALLSQAFPAGNKEKRLVEMLHSRNCVVAEWVCIHKNMVVAYIAFSNAYKDREVCGLHLAPLAVNPEYQRQGIGMELMRFAMRQDKIRNSVVFVLGDGNFYCRFGFAPSLVARSQFDPCGNSFFSSRIIEGESFRVGYEPEFMQM